jgi:hypothetical protein
VVRKSLATKSVLWGISLLVRREWLWCICAVILRLQFT